MTFTAMTFMELDELLDEVYRGQERLTGAAIQRAAIEAALSAQAMALVDGLPEGEYSRDEAAEALRQVPELLNDGDTDVAAPQPP